MAYRVNGTHDETLQSDGYDGKYFKLGADIEYTYSDAWDNVTSTEDNYEAIGGSYDGYYRYFKGHFDGNNKTISGIRIYKPDNQSQGLFGRTEGANIHDLTLADARITGGGLTGGIVGKNESGTITRCHIAADVTIRVGTLNPAQCFGGIAGSNFVLNSNSSTIDHCTSAVKISSSNDHCEYFGAITGLNNRSTLSDNLAIGATVPATSNRSSYGAICGNNDGEENAPATLERNYYFACTVAGVQNATGVGCGYIKDANNNYITADITANDGAVSGIALYDHGTEAQSNTSVIADNTGSGKNVILYGRTLFKNGAWNTLCLPFDVVLEGSPLAGATVMELDATGSYSGKQTGFDASTGTLYLYFKYATSIEAGKPYIVKWTSTGDNIVNPVFSGVTVSNSPAATVATAYTANDALRNVSFIGSYSPVALTPNDKSNLFLGTSTEDNKTVSTLYYPDDSNNDDGYYYINACRGYFHVDLKASPNPSEGGVSVRAFVLDFGDGEASGITTTNYTNYTNFTDSDAWYSLDGRKLDKRPTKAGLYIHGGHKVAIK